MGQVSITHLSCRHLSPASRHVLFNVDQRSVIRRTVECSPVSGVQVLLVSSYYHFSHQHGGHAFDVQMEMSHPVHTRAQIRALMGWRADVLSRGDEMGRSFGIRNCSASVLPYHGHSKSYDCERRVMCGTALKAGHHLQNTARRTLEDPSLVNIMDGPSRLRTWASTLVG